jgi:hypothetical protein
MKMSDEMIKEEFEKGKKNPENMVSVNYQKIISGYDAIDKSAAIGFYMKCKTTERLSKIEVLSKVIADCENYDCADNVICYIQDLLEEISE